MPIYRCAVLALTALLAFQGCRKELVDPDFREPEMPDIVLRAQEWVRECAGLSLGQELEFGTLDFLWEDHAVSSNSHGQAIVTVPARNPEPASDVHTELAFGVDDAGGPQGMVKRYVGDLAGEAVSLYLYTGFGQRAMAGRYYPATGKFSPRQASGLDRPIKMAAAKLAKKEAETLDGGTIEAVHVTASRSSSGGSSFGHWGHSSWSSFGGGGGSGAGGGGGGIGFGNGTGTSANPILIEPVYVKAPRKSKGVVFQVLPRVEDFDYIGFGNQPSPYHIRTVFARGGNNAKFRKNVEKTLRKLVNDSVGWGVYDCFPSGILKAVQHKQGANGALTFSLKPATFGPNGAYSPSTKTVSYVYGDYIDDMTTLHEILHYYQDISGHYPNMQNMTKNQTSGNKAKGFANIEFEVRLILDIMKGYGSEYMDELKASGFSKNELKAIGKDYELFIKSFRGSDKRLLNPDAMDRVKFKADHDRFLDYYATKSKNYRSEVDRKLEPKVLLELLKSIRNNCK